MADCLGPSMAVCIMEVSLVRRAIIERFHSMSQLVHAVYIDIVAVDVMVCDKIIPH